MPESEKNEYFCGLMKIDYRYIFERTRQMLMKPVMAWPHVWEENRTGKEMFRNYLLPIVLVISILVFLFSLMSYTVLQSIGLAFINLVSSLSGTWLAYLLIREYLCGKLNYRNNQALSLTVYSSAIFTIFHGLGASMGDVFIGQLFTLLSILFVRTLYAGIGQLPNIQTNQKTNVLVISSLSIICIPVIISQLMMIVFRISAITI